MNICTVITRRRMLLASSACVLAGFSTDIQAAERPKVAVITTVYRPLSHADVIVRCLLNGYFYYGEHCEPQVEVVSMYTDQVPENDMSRGLSEKHGFRI